MRVWSVVNEKGGVGKTTTALTLAGLAAERGTRVVLIDLDPHGSLTSFFRIDPENVSNGSFNLFDDPQALTELGVRQCLQATSISNLRLMPASTALASIDREPTGADGKGRILQSACALLKGTADLIIIDGPPMAGLLLVNAVLAATELLIPTQTEFLSQQGLARMVKTRQRLKDSCNESLADFLIVPTLYDRRTHASQASLQSLRDAYKDAVWDGQIALDTKFREAMASGVLPNHLPEECFGANSYGLLLDDLINRNAIKHESPTVGLGVQS